MSLGAFKRFVLICGSGPASNSSNRLAKVGSSEAIFWGKPLAKPLPPNKYQKKPKQVN